MLSGPIHAPRPPQSRAPVFHASLRSTCASLANMMVGGLGVSTPTSQEAVNLTMGHVLSYLPRSLRSTPTFLNNHEGDTRGAAAGRPR